MMVCTTSTVEDLADATGVPAGWIDAFLSAQRAAPVVEDIPLLRYEY